MILAFDVKVEPQAQEMADSLGVKIFCADIIYHLEDRFMEYRDKLKRENQEKYKNIAVFPCKLRIMPQYIFNSRDPIVLGVVVDAGFVKNGTPICVPTKEVSNLFIFMSSVLALSQCFSRWPWSGIMAQILDAVSSLSSLQEKAYI